MNNLFFEEKKILLKKIKILSKKKLFEKKESFNIFEALNLEMRENTHSSFIYELLNPNGKNPLNKIFLKLFFENVLIGENFNNKGFYNVYREHIIENGRPDFYFKDINKNYGIIIEMKIYAKDQKMQIKRYDDFLKNKHGDNYALYYLTLEGSDANKYSALDRDYIKISFKEHILIWIKKCLEEPQIDSRLSENLKQYLSLINKILNTSEDEDKMELKKLLLEGKHLRIVEEMKTIIPELKDEIEDEFWQDLRKQIIKKLQIEDNTKHIDFCRYDDNHRDIYFYKDIKSPTNTLLSFGLGRDSDGILFFYIGVLDLIKNKWITHDCPTDLKNKLGKVVNPCNNIVYVEDIINFNFNSEDFYILVEDDKKIEKDRLIESLIEIFKIKYEIIQNLFLK